MSTSCARKLTGCSAWHVKTWKWPLRPVSYTPLSLVSLDVNPSLQYTLNRLGLVLSVEAVNGDGDELLQEVGTLNNRSIEDAISSTVKQIAEDGYFEGD